MPTPDETCVTICACTYRRPAGLAALLEALAGQTFERSKRPKLSIVITDNEGSDHARELCDRFGRCSDIPIHYAHEPRRGICHARNRCLDQIAADCDFFAMIDDDEVPEPDWLERLLEAQRQTAADVVEGKVLPIFPDGTPKWIAKGQYFGWDHGLEQELDEARTNNVLVRYATIGALGLRFDPRFALTGGEDIVFFRAIKAAGHRIVHAPDACVREIIPPDRATLSYLWQRWYRVGCNDRFKQPTRRGPRRGIKGIVRRQLRNCGASPILLGLARLAGNLTVGRTEMVHLAPSIKLVANGLGRATSGLGLRYKHYR